MSKNTSVELGDEIANFIDASIATGRYASASEMIRAGLRLLQDQETRMANLRAALLEGESSGKPQAFDVEQFIAARKGEA